MTHACQTPAAAGQPGPTLFTDPLGWKIAVFTSPKSAHGGSAAGSFIQSPAASALIESMALTIETQFMRSRHSTIPEGLIYERRFVSPHERRAILDYLGTLRPIWEQRFSKNHPPPPGESQRWLLRPVYWLGNWQFACLNYYHPPKGILHRCVRAEPYPAVLAGIVARIEKIARTRYQGRDLPPGWKLNTCLINFYGSKLEDERTVDTARVGEHKDFEPGPVGSVSLGERALFQFVASQRRGERDGVVFQQWLEDSSLQIFGGERFKNQLFHRVQRVEKTGGYEFAQPVPNFLPRRINFTFRYVPEPHVHALAELPAESREDVLPYIKMLARHSAYFAGELASV